MAFKSHKQYRLPGYDYSSVGDYFITICTKAKIPYFGKIINANPLAYMALSDIGHFVKKSILSLPEIFKDVTLGEMEVMPNHIHLIITLAISQQSKSQDIIAPSKTLRPLPPGSVSSIINHLKGTVKKWCNANGHDNFHWQARFHDHIIRDTEEYNRISEYIAGNVQNWKDCGDDYGTRRRKPSRGTHQ